MKKCTQCKEEKKEIDFYKNKINKSGLYSHCKECHLKYQQKIKANNPKEYLRILDHKFIKYRNNKGIPLELPRKKKYSKTGHINKQGYRILISQKYIGHPCCNDKKGRVHEHRFVMYNHLGRPLRAGETVHHKNGIRHDNRLENLELWTKSHPPGQRVEDKIAWCMEFLSEYGYKVIKE